MVSLKQVLRQNTPTSTDSFVLDQKSEMVIDAERVIFTGSCLALEPARAMRSARGGSCLSWRWSMPQRLLWRLRRHYENCPSELPFNIRSTAPFVFLSGILSCGAYLKSISQNALPICNDLLLSLIKVLFPKKKSAAPPPGPGPYLENLVHPCVRLPPVQGAPGYITRTLRMHVKLLACIGAGWDEPHHDQNSFAFASIASLHSAAWMFMISFINQSEPHFFMLYKFTLLYDIVWHLWGKVEKKCKRECQLSGCLFVCLTIVRFVRFVRLFFVRWNLINGRLSIHNKEIQSYERENI